MTIENKEAETVAQAIFSKWFCKFGIPVQVYTDSRKEFASDLANSNFNLNNTQPLVQRAHSAPSPIQHFLQERTNKVNYRALHLGQEIQQVTQEIKQKCKSMGKSVRKSAKVG